MLIKSQAGIWGGSMVTALLLLWAGFCLWFYLGNNHYLMLVPIEIPSTDWNIVEGVGRSESDAVRIERVGRYGRAMAVARLSTAIGAGGVREIRIFFDQKGDVQETSLGIAESSSFNREYSIPISPVDDSVVRISAEDLHPRFDKINFINLSVRGVLREPLVVQKAEIALSRPGFIRFQSMIADHFIYSGSWTQRSINHARPDYLPLRFSPVIAVGLWVALTILFAATVIYFKYELKTILPGGIVVIAIGWIVLDISWQFSLSSRHIEAFERYSGKPAEEKRLSKDDADLFSFIDRLKKMTDESESPWLIFSSFNFDRFRARYHAVPQPIISKRVLTGRWLRRLRVDDILVVIHSNVGLAEAEVDSMNDPLSSGSRHEWPVSEIIGRDGELVTFDNNEWIKLQQGKRPWLVQSEWTPLSKGVWRMESGVVSREREGWLRLEVLRRNPEDSGGRERLAWREVFLRQGQVKRVSLSFQTQDGDQIYFRFRPLDARGVLAGDVSLAPLETEGNLVALSRDGDPPYWLARKILETEVGKAYEIY